MSHIFEIKGALLRAACFLDEADPDRIRAATEAHLSLTFGGIVFSLQEDLRLGSERTPEEYRKVESDVLRVQQSITEFRQQWLGPSRAIGNAIASLERRCEAAFHSIDEAAGHPEAEAVYARFAHWVEHCAASMRELAGAADYLTPHADGPRLREFAHAVESAATSAAERLGENWGQEVVPRWLDWLFHDVLSDDSGKSLDEFIERLCGDSSPEKKSAFYHVVTRTPRGEEPWWKREAARDGGDFLHKKLPFAIKEQSKRHSSEDHRSYEVRSREVSLTDVEIPTTISVSSDRAIEEAMALLQEKGLTERQAEIIVAVDGGGEPPKEVAERLGIHVKTIYSHLNHARKITRPA